MIHTISSVVYKAFGFHIASDIPLPELPQTSRREEQADIMVKKADLTQLWSECETPGRKVIVNEQFVLFQVPETAIFCIQGGDTITVSPIAGCGEDKIRLYVLGTCMGAILLQKQILPLHGSALAIDGKAYAIIGDSGAGKSTLASVLLNKGYPLLSDDVIAVTFGDDNTPMVEPSYPQQKLWQESIHKLNMVITDYQPLFERETKFAVPVKECFSTEPLPLAGVFELVKTEEETIGFQQIKGLERFHVLYRHTYRRSFLSSLGLTQWHFSTSVNLANQIELFQLRRPVSSFTAQDLANSILSLIRKGESQ